MDEAMPDLIVGIDLGMTCTGVAYANPSIGSNTVRWIQRWPGRMQANENKVPTVLVYPNNSATPSSWGFLAETSTEQNAPNKEVREWFKTYLDEECLRQEQLRTDDAPSSIGAVERWYFDYLRSLYEYLEARLRMELSCDWDNARVEFIFSVPTTWRPHPTVERFRSIITRAGFGSKPNHKPIIGLTEAEAAAVHLAREAPAIFKENEILLVCDAGGGTTDVSVLRVLGSAHGSLGLEQIDVVTGHNVGSAQLDVSFEKAVLERLKIANEKEPLGADDLEYIAWHMTKSREYQNAKCEYGMPDDTESFSVAIPHMNRVFSDEAAGIVYNEMRFKRDILRELFDAQIEKLFETIDKQLQKLSLKIPNERVAHLVLSGGLGNSAYVQRRLRLRYSASFGFSQMKVGVAPDPQLAVCKGIVTDRLERIRTGQSVLRWRCCRVSYGTLCRVLYDPKNPLHYGVPFMKDPGDGKYYIENVVNWFIKRGDQVSNDFPVTRPFRQRITLDNPYRIFPTTVVYSPVDKAYLPYTLNQYCAILCNVVADFSRIDFDQFQMKNRHFWSIRERHYCIDYQVKVTLGPADINFELWFNSQKLSRDNPVRVEWIAAPEPVETPELMWSNSPTQLSPSSWSPPTPGLLLPPASHRWSLSRPSIPSLYKPYRHSSIDAIHPKSPSSQLQESQVWTFPAELPSSPSYRR